MARSYLVFLEHRGISDQADADGGSVLAFLESLLDRWAKSSLFWVVSNFRPFLIFTGRADLVAAGEPGRGPAVRRSRPIIEVLGDADQKLVIRACAAGRVSARNAATTLLAATTGLRPRHLQAHPYLTMRAWPGQKATPAPKTNAGRWLRAALLSQLQRREQLRGALNGGDVAGLRYRYSTGKRLGNVLFGVIVLLLGVLVIAALIVSLVDPAAFGHGPPQGIGDLVLPAIVVCVLAFFMCGAFYLVKVAILDRLVVTSDGLISRRAGFIKVQTTTMPWSSITSFTVMPALGAGRRAGYRNAVYAIPDSGQPVALPGTERRLVAAAAIAEKLTAMLDEHRAGSRSSTTTDSVAERASPSPDTTAIREGSGTYQDDSAV